MSPFVERERPAVVVIGGAGYIGSVLVRRLMITDHYVTVLDRLDHGPAALASLLPALSTSRQRRLRVLVGDVRDRALLARACHSAVGIINLAGVVGTAACDARPDEAVAVNTEAAAHVAALADDLEIPHVYASTGVVYGRVSVDVVDEETPLNPQTRYAETKARAEAAVVEAGGVVLRLATLYGVSYRMRWDLLPHDLLWQAMRGGAFRLYQPDARRLLLRVSEAARAFQWALDRSSGIYDIGYPQTVTKRGIVNIIRDMGWFAGGVTQVVDEQDRDARDYVCTFAKARAARFKAQGLFGTHQLQPLVPLVRAWQGSEGKGAK